MVWSDQQGTEDTGFGFLQQHEQLPELSEAIVQHSLKIPNGAVLTAHTLPLVLLSPVVV